MSNSEIWNTGDSLPVLAGALVYAEPRLIGELPKPLTAVAQWLAASPLLSLPAQFIYDAMINLISILPSVFVVEKVSPFAVFLDFYFVDALKRWMQWPEVMSPAGTTCMLPSEFMRSLAKELDGGTAILSLKKQFRAELNAHTGLETQAVMELLPQAHKSIEICSSSNYAECIASKNGCQDKIHFERIISPHTDQSLGDCSYLDTCYKGKSCKYVHYKIIYPPGVAKKGERSLIKDPARYESAQFLHYNLLRLNFRLLGNDWAAMIIDPPWDIHVNGTGAAAPSGPAGSNESGIDGIVSDLQVANLDVASLQTEGVVFLWVTGRVTDVGRKCLSQWGYDHVEELIWCKTNQLARTICTGRTGHWLNHTKEHVLVGVKGKPEWLRRQVDVDVLVSTARGHSQKPEELYNIIERMVGPERKKLELFGRRSNIRSGWLTIGNEIGTNRITDVDLARRLGVR